MWWQKPQFPKMEAWAHRIHRPGFSLPAPKPIRIIRPSEEVVPPGEQPQGMEMMMQQEAVLPQPRYTQPFQPTNFGVWGWKRKR
jgi:hypothetical protein